MSLLLEAFDNLPKPDAAEDLDLWEAGAEQAIREFRELAENRYTEGTLCRILGSSEDPPARRAAAFALGFVGTMSANPAVALALRTDSDDRVRRFAIDSLWEIWFRGDSVEQGRELRLALSLNDSAQQLVALDDVIQLHPDFAEVYNQRAILWFRRGQYGKAVADCEHALRLNPNHFGAASGLGQCHLRMNRPHAALRALALALDLNPTLNHLAETIQSLRQTLGNE